MSTHFLSFINGWIWSNWCLGAQIHVETVLSVKKMKTHFLSLGQENEFDGWIWSNWGLGAKFHMNIRFRSLG